MAELPDLHIYVPTLPFFHHKWITFKNTVIQFCIQFYVFIS